MLPSRYFIMARLAPAAICAVPFLIFNTFFLSNSLTGVVEAVSSAKLVGNLSMSFVFIILLALIGRSISKDLFERAWFKADETRMPTTELLLHKNTEYSPELKQRLFQNIEQDFGIHIFSAAEEDADEVGARKRIAEAVAAVRQRVKDGRLLLQHNIEYGFFRNLAGCSFIALVMSIVNICLFYTKSNRPLLIASICLLGLYLLPLTFAKSLMKAHGYRYARVLTQEYLASHEPAATKQSRR